MLYKNNSNQDRIWTDVTETWYGCYVQNNTNFPSQTSIGTRFLGKNKCDFTRGVLQAISELYKK